jgi:protein-tyrosine-phosphatase
MNDRRDEIHVVAVCTGNICRSPMAEGILSRMPGTFPHVKASSAGTYALDGYPPSEFSVIACRERGIDISGHRAKRLEEGIIGGSDIIICMEPVHVEMVLSLDASAAGKIYNLADFSGGRLKKIADPYGCSLREYRQCFRDILDCIGEFLEAKCLSGGFCCEKRFPLSAL